MLSIASVLGKSFESKDLETLAEDAPDLDDEVDRLVREGMLEEERESRGDRLAFSSGIVRDVLYAALSRRKRRVAPPKVRRAPREALRRAARARLSRARPSLLAGGRRREDRRVRPEARAEVARRLQPGGGGPRRRRSRSTTSRTRRTGDGSPREAEARLLLARATAWPATSTARCARPRPRPRLRGGEAGRRGPAPRNLLRRGDGLAGAPRRRGAPLGRARAWRWRAPSGDAEHLPRAPVARGDPRQSARGVRQAAAYQAEIERAAPPKTAAPTRKFREGGTLVVAVANPISATEPGLYQTSEEQEVLANVFEPLVTTDPQGNPAPALCEKWTLEEGGLAVRLHLRPGAVFSDGSPVNARGREGLARTLDPALARPAAGGLRRDPRGLRVPRGGRRRRSPTGSRSRGEREIVIRLDRSASDLPLAPDGPPHRDRRPRGDREARRPAPGRSASPSIRRIGSSSSATRAGRGSRRASTGSSSGLRSRRRRSRRAFAPASSTSRGICCPRTSRRSSASRASARASSRRPRRTPTSPSSTPGARPARTRRCDRRSPASCGSRTSSGERSAVSRFRRPA